VKSEWLVRYDEAISPRLVARRGELQGAEARESW